MESNQTRWEIVKNASRISVEGDSTFPVDGIGRGEILPTGEIRLTNERGGGLDIAPADNYLQQVLRIDEAGIMVFSAKVAFKVFQELEEHTNFYEVARGRDGEKVIS